MSSGPVIGSGQIQIKADVKPFDAAMADLPKKAAAKMDAAMKALQAKAAQTKIELKAAYKAGDLATQQRLLPIYDQLRAKIAAVENAAVKQANAIRAASAAAQAAANAQQIATQAALAAQQRAAANAIVVAQRGQSMNAIWLEGQTKVTGGFGQTGSAAQSAGRQVRDGGANGAMGLMLLAQTIDDAQYGFRAIVNNIPQVAVAVGTSLGASTEAAMKFGGALGIAAVAVNTLASNSDHLKEIFGGSQSEDMQKIVRDLTTMENAVRSLFASMVNLDRGFNWISTTREESAATAKAMEQRAAAAAEAAARAKANRGTVEGARSTGEIQRGETFGKALAAYGGGDKLAEELYGKRTAGMNMGALSGDALATRQKYYREGIDSDIAAAMKGDQAALARIGKEAPGLKGHLAFNAPGAKEARDKAASEKKTAIDRTAGKFASSLGDEFLQNPDMGLSETWAKLKEAMTEAGYSLKEIGDQLPGVAHKLKQDTLTKIKERAAAEGVDFETARGMLLSESARAKANKAESTPAAREASRLAAAMEGGVGRRLFEDGGMSDANLEREVRAGLKSAGLDNAAIDASAAQVAKKLREGVEQQVQGRALSEGVTEGQARADMLKEMNERQDQGQPKAEILSTESYLSKLLVGAMDKKDETPQKQLDEAKTTNKLLGNVIKALDKPKKGTYAMAAPGGR